MTWIEAINRYMKKLGLLINRISTWITNEQDAIWHVLPGCQAMNGPSPC